MNDPQLDRVARGLSSMARANRIARAQQVAREQMRADFDPEVRSASAFGLVRPESVPGTGVPMLIERRSLPAEPPLHRPGYFRRLWFRLTGR